MSRWLGIGTSSPALSCALFEGGRLLAQDHRLIGRGHAEALVPAIAALPGKGRAEAVFVDVGPGSFTGIRLGVAAARALGLAWQVPVHGVPAAALLAARAFAAAPELQPVLVLLDAGRGQLFAQQVDRSFVSRPVLTFSADRPPPGFAAGLALAGAGASMLPPGAGTTPVHAGQPDMAWLAALPESARSLPPEPLYVRPPDAVLPL